MGRITRQPELRHTSSGKAVSSFTLAVDRGFAGDSGCDFINCVAWDVQAELLCRHVKKGQLITVEGRLQTRQYSAKGDTRYVTEVVCEKIYFGEIPKEE